MTVFDRDAAAYLDWLDHHRDAFVIDVPRHGSATALVLHRAGCAFIGRFAHTSYTTGA
jgi:hypothetical protein